MDRPRAPQPPRRPAWLDRPWLLLVEKHAGPGAHKGTGTPQTIHSRNARTRAAARAEGAQNRATGKAGRPSRPPKFKEVSAPTEAPEPVPTKGAGGGVSKADVDAALAELGGRMDRFGLDENGNWDPEIADRHTEALAKLGAKMRARLDELAEANGTAAASFAEDVSVLLTERDALYMRSRLRSKTGGDLTGEEAARLAEIEAEMGRREIVADHRFDPELLSMARRTMMSDLFDEAGYPMSDAPVVARTGVRSDRRVSEALADVGRDGWFPRSVVDRMNEPFYQVEAGTVRGRGRYENRSKRVHLSGGPQVEMTRVAVHEFGHAVQFAHDVQQAEFGFLRRHADLGSTVPLGGSGEVGWARAGGGRWHEPYLARRYSDGVLDHPGPSDRSYNPTAGDRAFEVFTVGLETLYGFLGGAADSGTRGVVREHAEWTLGTLAVLAAQGDD